jgi:hypothetical protein
MLTQFTSVFWTATSAASTFAERSRAYEVYTNRGPVLRPASDPRVTAVLDDNLDLIHRNGRLRAALCEALKQYPQSRAELDAIVREMPPTVTPAQVHANLRKRAESLIRRHPEAADPFKSLLDT